MAAPIVIDIPHQLGREGAKRRMTARVGELARHIPVEGAAVSASWPSEDRMALAIAAMGQKIDADLDVEERLVRVTLKVPLLLSFMSGPIAGIVRKSAEALLLDDGTPPAG